MRLVLTLSLLCVFFCTQAQEEFILGKSANTLKRGNTVISGEYSVFAFENIRPKRAGLEISYGLSDRFNLSVKGSASNFQSSSLSLETGNVTAIYQLGNYQTLPKKWTFAPFAQISVVSRSAQIPGDINFDTHSSGFALGMIANRNFEYLTLSGSLAYAKINFPRLLDGLIDGYGLLYQLSANKSSDLNFNGTQITVGLIAELTGQYNTPFGQDLIDLFDESAYLDLLGGIQLTLDNQYRVEIGIQSELAGNTNRFSEGYYHIRLKYLMW